MVSFTKPSPRDMALIGVYLVVAIDMLASALTVPVMPFFVSKICGCEEKDETKCTDPICSRLGGASSALGFMFSSFALAQLMSNGWMGPLSDTVGRRAILTVTLGGAGIGMLASSLAPSFFWLVASRIFIGACSGTMSAANAYIADVTSAKERPALMANVRARSASHTRVASSSSNSVCHHQQHFCWCRPARACRRPTRRLSLAAGAQVGTLVQLCFMFGPGVGAGLAELDNRAPFWVRHSLI